MLKKLILENWKSFRYAELPIDPLTVLIGTNASGKSNAIEALEFLNRITHTESIQTALIGDKKLSSIRGGVDWVSYKARKKQFILKILIQGENDSLDYLYSVALETATRVLIISESIIKIEDCSQGKNPKTFELLYSYRTTQEPDKFSVSIVGRQHETEVSINNSTCLLGLLYKVSGLNLFPVVDVSDDFLHDLLSLDVAAKKIFETLRNIFVLEPSPSSMRSYSALSNELMSNGSNLAGVLAALPKKEKAAIESTLISYVAYLPERDIQRVWAETVGRLNSDAMLYCEESWASDEPPMVIDARGMSDGTLRFLAIVTALLTRPEGSQLVIEEVDNGLHPSRAELLLKMLKELGAKRKIDVLVTTHNPALLDALGLKMVPFVVVAHRDAQTGESKLTPLDDIQHLPKLLASGSVGDLATQGTLEKVLSHSDES